LCLLLSKVCFAGNIYEQFPVKVNASDKYVFYSHGLIVEGDDPTPISPLFGKYEFPQIKQALADEGYHLIAYHRPKNTQAKAFAKKLVKDVNLLIEQGIKPENITLLGFSRGGEITIRTSHYLKSPKVRIGLLAACVRDLEDSSELRLYGRIYSIFETSDSVGSCQFLIKQSPQVTRFNEVAISTGQGHGAFYRPLPEWIDPVKAWLNQL
jgi:hypothetical protein